MYANNLKRKSVTTRVYFKKTFLNVCNSLEAKKTDKRIHYCGNVKSFKSFTIDNQNGNFDCNSDSSVIPNINSAQVIFCVELCR